MLQTIGKSRSPSKPASCAASERDGRPRAQGWSSSSPTVRISYSTVWRTERSKPRSVDLLRADLHPDWRIGSSSQPESDSPSKGRGVAVLFCARIEVTIWPGPRFQAQPLPMAVNGKCHRAREYSRVDAMGHWRCGYVIQLAKAWVTICTLHIKPRLPGELHFL